MTDDQATLSFLGQLERQHKRSAAPAGDGKSLRATRRGAIAAAYDAAQTTDLNKRYWKNADLLSPDAANNPTVRAELRRRARYECFEASPFGKRIVTMLANAVIGKGPRLQMQLPDPVQNARIEGLVNGHFRRIGLAKKLRTMKLSRAVSGEGCAHFTTNRRHPAIQVDLALFEPDQLSSPMLLAPDANTVDGIRFDDDGNPETYFKLKSHPGSDQFLANLFEADEIPASEMLHTFRVDRPGQHRGIPEVTTALPLFALLRDYTLAVLHSARSAAKFTALLKTQQGAFADNLDTVEQDRVDAFEAVDIDYDMLCALPFGYDVTQLKAEQPTTTYEMFRNAILNEIAACVLMPANVSLGDSSEYNFASGRLDTQSFYQAIDIERDEWAIEIVEPILLKVLEEALFIPGLLPAGLPPFDALPHEWHWDGHPAIDESKEANAQKTRIASGTTHRAREYARDGLDIDAEDQRAAAAYGVSLEQYRRALFGEHFKSGAAAEDDDETEEQRERIKATAENWLQEMNTV